MSNSPQTHLIVDIETLSTRPSAVVLSLACTAFQFEVPQSFNYYVENGFHVKIEVEPQIRAGRKIDQDTVDWWLKQTPEARLITKKSADDTSPADALDQFRLYIENLRKHHGYDDKGFVWSRGSNFDFPIIETLHHDFEKKLPFSNWRIRCLKTMFDVMTGGDWGQYEPESGTPKGFLKHNALHDTAMDAIRCTDIFRVTSGL